MNCIVHWNALYTISQSPWFLTVLVGFECPNWNSKSPNVSGARLSVMSEWITEMIMLRSTAFPCSTLTHSESRNSGSPLALNRLCFVTLILIVWFWLSLQVSFWLGVSTLISESSSLTQANIVSSAPLLPGLISGLGVPYGLLIPYSTAAPVSLGWGPVLAGLPLVLPLWYHLILVMLLSLTMLQPLKQTQLGRAFQCKWRLWFEFGQGSLFCTHLIPWMLPRYARQHCPFQFFHSSSLQQE